MPKKILKNSKTFIVAAFMILIIPNCFAQNLNSVAKSQFKINVLLPGLVYEYGLSSKNTLYAEISSGYGYTSNMFGSTWSFYPYVDTQFRHYYNLEKRLAKNKTIAHNTGSFLAVSGKYNFQSINTSQNFLPANSSFTLAPTWGFQRTYNKKFNLDLSAGIGYNFQGSDSNVTPVLNFTLGWVIGK
ncbi:MAG: hypothetical protein ACK4M4_02280 [Flavobacterium sp.]